ncbi:MAG: hypothetical protein K940chlam7_00306 [Chlamydiae bacterium]|nr:hypothetical protein [Chlamydiota bacterium]
MEGNKESNIMLWVKMYSSSYLLTNIYSFELDPKNAEEHLQQRIQEFQGGDRKHSLIFAYWLLSSHYQQHNDYAKALKSYESMADITDQFDHSHLAWLYKKNDQWKEAENCYYTALEKNGYNQPWIYIGLGICKTRQHRFDDAKSDYLKAQTIYKERNDPAEAANTVNCIAYLHFLQNEAEPSIRYALEAIEILEQSQVDAPSYYCAFYDTLACAYELNGQFDLAEEYFLKAIEIGKIVGDDQRTLAKKYLSLGNVYLKQNRIEEARNFWKESLDYLDEIADRELSTKVKYNLKQNPVEIPRIQQYAS